MIDQTKTTNCNIYKEKCDVYCGRGKGVLWNPVNCKPGDEGLFGNPISMGKKCLICSTIHESGGSTLLCYEKYLKNRLESDSMFAEEFYKLKGKKLGCFCKPKDCHTDVMIRYLDSEKK